MATSTAIPKQSSTTGAPGPLAAGAARSRRWPPAGIDGWMGRACRWTDLAVLQAVFLGAVALRYLRQGHMRPAELLFARIPLRSVLVAATAGLIWRTVLRTSGLYNPRRIKGLRDYLGRCLFALTGCAAAVAAIEWIVFRKPSAIAVHTALVFWLISILALAAARASLLVFDRSVRPHLRAGRNLLIVGTGSRAADVYDEMRANRDIEYNLIGYVDSEPQQGYIDPDTIVGDLTQLEAILMHQVVDEVVIALPMKSQYQTIGETVALCERLGVRSQYFTHHFGTHLTKQRWVTGRRVGRMVLETVHRDSRLFLKRAIDLTGAACGILALSPLLLGAAIAIKLTSPGPILYRQTRFGFNKRRFSMLKFRSMVADAEARQHELEHLNEAAGPAFKIARDPRLTPIGGFLRKRSIDELPQLFNVLAGHMSLVGPRPMALRDVSRFPEAWLMRRFSVKPGLTCIWQTSGRSNVDFDRWIEMDLEYIDNWSLTLDLEILLRTVPAVLKGHGAS